MLQTLHYSEFSRPMDLFKEIDDISDLFLLERNTKLDCIEEGYEDLQSKYSNLHENYAKEIENSKKVEKCLIKCLKFYSKLSKKYEVQQQIIRSLEESIKEKVNSLEEAQRNEEKMKGLIQVYRTERALYAGQTSEQLRREKEVLLDICCKLISESVKSNSISNFSNLLLRKFKKDLNDENVNLLKAKSIKLKDELESDAFKDLKPDFGALKEELKWEDKYSEDVGMVKMKDCAEETKTNQVDLSLCKMTTEGSSYLENEYPSEVNDALSFVETEQEESSVVPSLPSLEEPPLSLEPICTDSEEHQEGGVAECDPSQDGSEIPIIKPTSSLGGEDAASLENISQSQNVCSDTGAPASALEDYFLTQSERRTTKGSASIFDVCDPCLNVSDSGAENEKKEKLAVEVEFFSQVSFKSDDTSEDLSLIKDTVNTNVTDHDEDENGSVFPYEDEVFKIFREMSSIRLLSPIRESCNSVKQKTTETGGGAVTPNENKNFEDRNSGPCLKRNSEVEENCCRNKRLKSVEENPKCCLLDSIMSAMSIQNEEFKSKNFAGRESAGNGEISDGSSCEFVSPRSRASARRKRKENSESEGKSAAGCRTPGRSKDRQQAMERLVTEEIKNFVSSAISCKEDADKNVKRCISALSNKPEDVIAKCIVAIVFENIDETVEIFERPAPPLTKTQHRLIILLSVLRTLEWNSEKISAKILSIISEKIFPDNFFWPDDCVEAATRFYAALCRARNDPKTLWKFCLNAMTDMRQRCPLLVFTALKTWPDVLHDASTLKNNLLAVTVVNIFLHMPKTEGLRNVNQKRKLVALKHLLINFYQFKVEETIEDYAKELLEAIRREEAGAEKSILLLSKCRDRNWTLKNVVPKLKSSLVEWSEGAVGDSVASTILSVIKQISPILMQENNAGGKMKDLTLCLSEILASRKKSHDAEVNLVEVLLQLKQFSEARKAICEWIPKSPINDSLRNEIINASADNILRELKLNRRKETKNFTVKKKQWKKSKGKKKKGKKRKKNEQKPKVE